jgi:hypothetical protein
MVLQSVGLVCRTGSHGNGVMSDALLQRTFDGFPQKSYCQEPEVKMLFEFEVSSNLEKSVLEMLQRGSQNSLDLWCWLHV